MRPGIHLATALAEGAPLWGGTAMAGLRGANLAGRRPTPAVVTRVRRGTALPVHAAPAFDGYWWLVQTGPWAGRLIRQHDPAWSINP